ncbi:MAG: hypothetical protein FJW21_13870 [Acidimicrobiia bacterium]|nr:hypothetical protein [Acidimicrobiia bacterium]
MRLLVYAQDPGGSILLARVLTFAASGLPEEATLVVHPMAEAIMAGVPMRQWALGDVVPSVPASEPDIEAWLTAAAPSHIIATSSSRVLDLTNARLVAVARRLGIRTLTLLDHWVGFDRFLDAEGRPSYLPDVVGCIDRFCQSRVQALGTVETPLVGHPNLEYLAQTVAGPAPRSRPRIVVVSQPVVSDGTMTGAWLRPIVGGLSVLDAVVAAAAAVSTGCDVSYRPHPKELPSAGGIGVPVDREPGGIALLERYDIFVGATSMLLCEAAVAGRQVVQLNLAELAGLVPDEYPPYMVGTSVRDLRDLAAALSTAVLSVIRGERGSGIPGLDLRDSNVRAERVMQAFLGSM